MSLRTQSPLVVVSTAIPQDKGKEEAEFFTIWCLVAGDSRAFKVTPPVNADVADLKEAVREKGVDIPLLAKDLELWKLKTPLNLTNQTKDTLSRVKVEDGDEELKDWNPISHYWPQLPPATHLHVIVKLPYAETGSGSRNQLPTVTNELYAACWNNSLDNVFLDESDDSRKLFKYVPKAQIERLRLPHLGYCEDALLVREEYTIGYQTLSSRSLQSKSNRGGGVVVIGQPGIGKTSFLFYILLRRLSERLPTALQTNDDWFFLFTKDGATVHSTEARNYQLLPPGTWALADSNASIGKPCGAFLHSQMNVWVLQTTSPLKARWYEWSKQRSATKYIMDWFPQNELGVLGKILGLNIDSLLSYHRIWGPSARICLKLARNIVTAPDLDNSATIAAQGFVGNPMGMAALLAELDATKVSHVLFALRPQAHDRRDIATAEIPTDHLHGFVVRAAAQLDKVHQTEFFSKISGHPWFKGSAGYVYEKFVHARLLSGSSHQALQAVSAKSRTKLIIPICDNMIPLGGLSGLKTANKYPLPFYWRPVSQSFPSIDSLICTQSKILFIQSTLSLKHNEIPDGVRLILLHLPVGFRDSRELCLVFITNTEENAETLRKQKFDGVERVNVYSCVFRIGESVLTAQERAILLNKDGKLVKGRRKRAPVDNDLSAASTSKGKALDRGSDAKKRKRKARGPDKL